MRIKTFTIKKTRSRITIISLAFLLISSLSLLLFSPSLFTRVTAQSPTTAQCPTISTNNGQLTTSITLAATQQQEYKVWSRIKPSLYNQKADSFYLKVNDGCPIEIGGSDTLTPGEWVWIDWTNGDQNKKATFSLAPGTHTITLIGKDQDVSLDKVYFTSNFTCTPSGTGEDCIQLAQPTATITPSQTPLACYTSSPTWHNTSFTEQQDIFTATYDATPLGDTIDAVTGFSNGTASAHTNLAVITRFNPDGFIDARNGSAYSAVAQIPYIKNKKYTFRVEINIPQKIYSAYVTPDGENEKVIGTNFAFRSEQASVSLLNTTANYGQVGAHSFCDPHIATTLPTPTNTPIPTPTHTPTPLPTNTPTPSPRPTNTPTPTLRPTNTPTPTPRPTNTPTPTPVVNLLKNPGFEAGMSNWENWGNTQAVKSNAQAGSYAARTGTGSGGAAQLVQGIKPGISYILTGWGKVSNSSYVGSIGVTYYDSSWNDIGESSTKFTSTSFTKVTLTFTPPAYTAYTYMWTWKEGTKGYIYVDSLSVIKK